MTATRREMNAFGAIGNTSAVRNGIEVLISLENTNLRSGLANTIHANYPMAHITEAPTFFDHRSSVEARNFDAIIVAAELTGRPTYPLCKEMREGRTGAHPFPIVSLVTDNLDNKVIRDIIDSGPDDIILLPTTPDGLRSRIDAFVLSRKPFVVTRDYTGPDRRKALRPGSEPAPTLTPPNPLSAKLQGVSRENLAANIRNATLRLHALKLERYGAQLKWLQSNPRLIVHGDAGSMTDRIRAVCHEATETLSRIDHADSAAIASTCQKLMHAAETIAAKPETTGLVVEFETATQKLTQELHRLAPHG